MKYPTWKVMLSHSKAAIDDQELELVQSFLSELPENSYYITADPIPVDSKCHYMLAITVLRESCEKAAPIADEIEKALNSHNIKTKRYQTELLWNNTALHIDMQ